METADAWPDLFDDASFHKKGNLTVTSADMTQLRKLVPKGMSQLNVTAVIVVVLQTTSGLEDAHFLLQVWHTRANRLLITRGEKEAGGDPELTPWYSSFWSYGMWSLGLNVIRRLLLKVIWLHSHRNHLMEL